MLERRNARRMCAAPRPRPGRLLGPLLALVLLSASPVRAALFEVTVSNPAIYTAVFLVDTTADTIVWQSGLDGPGPNTFWTPAVPRLLDVTASAGFEFPDDPVALRQLFIDPDFTAGPSDQWLPGYPDSDDGMEWNEGESFIPNNHAFVESGGAALRMPTGPLISSQASVSAQQGGSTQLLPGWSVTVAGVPPVPTGSPFAVAVLLAALVATAIALARRPRDRRA